MDSLWTRLSNLVSFYVVVLACCGLFNYTTGLLFWWPTSDSVSFKSIEPVDFGVHRYLKADQILFAMNLETDVSRAFHWNTHQLFAFAEGDYSIPDVRPRNEVVFWDAIVRNAEEAKFNITDALGDYPFRDYGRRHLQNRTVNFRFRYQMMPKTGFFHTVDVGTMEQTLPATYATAADPRVRRQSYKW